MLSDCQRPAEDIGDQEVGAQVRGRKDITIFCNTHSHGNRHYNYYI